MYRLFLLLASLALAGCLRPITSRLDEANARLAQVSQQLDETNHRLALTERRLDEANQKLGTVEKAVKQVPGFKF